MVSPYLLVGTSERRPPNLMAQSLQPGNNGPDAVDADVRVVHTFEDCLDLATVRAEKEYGIEL